MANLAGPFAAGRATDTTRSDYIWLTAILVLAVVLRLPGLNGPLWYDEIATVTTHLRLPWNEMFTGYEMNHHYLYSLQAKALMEIFGEEPWVIRLPSLVFGVLGIGAMWWLARDIAGARIAHVTALLLAIAFHHIWFSQNARGYSELQFWSTLGMILFLYGLKRPTPGLWIGYGLVLALAVYTHLTGAFFFAAQGVLWVGLMAAFAMQGRATREVLLYPALGFVVGGLLTLALYAPLLPSLLETVGGVSETSAVDRMQEYQNPVWTVVESVRSMLGTGGLIAPVIAIVLLAVLAMGAVASHRTERYFAPVVVLHIGLTMVLLMLIGMRIWPRFFFLDIGFLMLLIVLGVQYWSGVLAWIVGNRVERGLIFAVGVAGMILVSLPLAVRNYTQPKQDLVGALTIVEEGRGPSDRVYGLGSSMSCIRAISRPTGARSRRIRTSRRPSPNPGRSGWSSPFRRAPSGMSPALKPRWMRSSI